MKKWRGGASAAIALLLLPGIVMAQTGSGATTSTATTATREEDEDEPPTHRTIFVEPLSFELPIDADIARRFAIDFITARVYLNNRLIFGAYHGSYPSFPLLDKKRAPSAIEQKAINGIACHRYEEMTPKGRRGEALFRVVEGRHESFLHLFYEGLTDTQAKQVRAVIDSVKKADVGKLRRIDTVAASMYYESPAWPGAKTQAEADLRQSSTAILLSRYHLDHLEDIAKTAPAAPANAFDAHNLRAVIDTPQQKGTYRIDAALNLQKGEAVLQPSFQDKLRLFQLLDELGAPNRKYFEE